MANIIPLKCANNQHEPMVPGVDTIPPELVNPVAGVLPGANVTIVRNPDGSITISNACTPCTDGQGT